MARAMPVPPEGKKPIEEKSTPNLVRQIIQETGELIQQEFRLLRQELLEALGKASTAGALIGVGAILLLLGAVYLGATFMLLLSLAVTPWISAAIVTLIFLAIGGIVVYVGIRNFRNLKLAPRTVETLKEDAEWLSHPTKLEEK
ncbi:MAG: phage holin family protein [Firmicutes bacterium]|nr:phage holin family protein [Bacillota bacterium]